MKERREATSELKAAGASSLAVGQCFAGRGGKWKIRKADQKERG